MKTNSLYPLTHPQNRIWYLEQIYPFTSLHNITGTIHIKGNIDLDILRQAIVLFLKRNNGTQLQITLKNNEPYQFISSTIHTDIPFIDFSNKKNPENEFNEWVEMEAGKPFILIESPLYKFCIFKISQKDMGYLLKYHHIICDGFSTTLLTSQVIDNYKKIIAGEDIELLNEYNYLDYIESEKEYLNSERYERNKLYWNTKFRVLPELPLKRSSDVISGARKSFYLDGKYTKEINELIKQFNISLNSFYTGILLIYLYKITGQKDQVIGIPVLNRFGRKERHTFGMFTSTMPFRMNIDRNNSIKEFYRSINNEFSSCYLNQKYPYNLLAQDLKLRKYGYKTLFDIFVNYYNIKHVTHLNNFIIETKDYHNGMQIYSLQVIIREWSDSGNISLSFDYKTQDYTESEIGTIYSYFELITEQIIHNTDTIVNNIGLVSEANKKKLVYDFNMTDSPYPKDKTIHALFEEQVKKTPDNIAVSFNNLSITYKELNEKSNQVAYLIRGKVNKENQIIAVTGHHSIELIICLLGILKSGNIFIPLDPDTPVERIKIILKETEAPFLFLSNNVIKNEDMGCPVIKFDNKDIYSGQVDNLNSAVTPMDNAYIIYTSGSTGKPKGVMITHKSFINYIWWAKKHYKIKESDIFAFYSSISFDLTLTSIFTPLMSGAQVRIYNPFEDSDDFVLFRIFKENKATILKLTPSHLNLIKENNNSNSAIKRFIVGGENLKTELVKKIYESFEGDIEIYNEYGPTEATVGCMIYKYDVMNDTGISVPIGKPIDNSTIYILDDNLILKPVGAIGEIYISKDCLSKGYYKDKALTDKRFIQNPFAPHQLMYKSGDLARYIDNNTIEYIGRNDNQVKIRGHRIELEEIEKVLVSMKGITQCVVITKTRMGSDILCAYSVSEEKIGEHSIKSYLSGFLPDYMIPSYFIFIDKIPLTKNGKVDKSSLPDPCYNDEKKADLFCPGTEMESVFLTILKETLNAISIHISDNFYQLGGDSIKAILLAAKLNNNGYVIKAGDILTHPVIHDMINYIDQGNNKHSIDQNPCEGEIPNTPIIEWFFSSNFNNPNYYTQSVMLEMKTDIEIKEMEKALCFLINHHDSMRINYNPDLQVLFYNKKHTDYKITLPVHYINNDTDNNHVYEIKRICEEIKSSFIIEESFLFKGCVFKLTGIKTLLFLCAHHLIIDGVSWGILLTDLRQLLLQNKLKNNFHLPLKTHSFKYWSEYQKNIKLINIEDKINYWKNLTANDFNSQYIKNGDNSIACRKMIKHNLSKELTTALLTEVYKIYKLKTDELLIIALVLSMKEYVNNEHITMELENHGRFLENEDINLSRTIGWFTSLYPVCLTIPGLDLNDTIRLLKEQLRDPTHPGLEYGLLKYSHKKFTTTINNAIRVNYLGDLTTTGDNEYFGFSSIDHGDDTDQANKLSCLFEINAVIFNDQLNLNIVYDTYTVSDAFMKNFLSEYIKTIKHITDFCINKNKIEFTPSDFDTIDLNQEELDSLFNNE